MNTDFLRFFINSNDNVYVLSQPETPAVSHDDWQLGKWISSIQPNSSTETQCGTHVARSPTHKQLLPTQSSRHFSVEVVDPSGESKPQLSSHQKELGDGVAKPQQCRETHQDNCYQQSSQNPLPADFRKLSCKTHSSKPAKKSCPDRSDATVSVKCEEVVATRVKDPCFTDRPKVKTKPRHISKKSKDGSDSKQDAKRTIQHTSLDKRKSGSKPELTQVVFGQGPACGVRYPNPCSYPTQNPAQPNRSSPVPPLKISSSKPQVEQGTKKSHKTSHKHLAKTRPSAKGSQDLLRPARPLLVKIDLSLLTRVPQTSSSHQEMPSGAKRSVVVIEQNRGGGNASTTQKQRKTSKKSIPPNVRNLRTHLHCHRKVLCVLQNMICCLLGRGRE